MKVIVNNNMEYSDVLGDYYDLIRYNDNSTTEVFFQGYSTTRNEALKREHANYTKRCYINLESPTGLIASTSNIIEQQYFTHVYSICPLTSEWLRNKIDTKFIDIAFPITMEVFNKFNTEKQYDVMYMGQLMNQDHRNIIDVVKKHNHIFTSRSDYPRPYQPTHININSNHKWELLAKTKICITVNQAPFNGSKYISNLKSYPDWQSHKGMNKIEMGIIPQFKSRVTEAMGLRTLNLVKRDEWNIIESWFTPNEHFIYWDDYADLNNKITEITNNFDDYKHIIDAAYDEVQKYDIHYLFKNVITNGI